jgi:hypothetical protein
MATEYPSVAALIIVNPSCDEGKRKDLRDKRLVVVVVVVAEGTKEVPVVGFNPAKACVVGKREDVASTSTAATVEQLNLMLAGSKKLVGWTESCSLLLHTEDIFLCCVLWSRWKKRTVRLGYVVFASVLPPPSIL